MRLILVLSLFCVLLASAACQRTSLPYGGVDKTQEDATQVQPDPARIGN